MNWAGSCREVDLVNWNRAGERIDRGNLSPHFGHGGGGTEPTDIDENPFS